MLHDNLCSFMRRLLSEVIAVALALAGSAAAQEPTDTIVPGADASAAGSDSDPTKPIAFSLRDEFVKLSSSSSSNVFILRLDRLVLKGLGMPGVFRGVLGRVDLPLVTIRTPADTETGLGDLYLQALVAPRIKGRFTIAVGTGLGIPTATAEELGTGKWVLAPAVVPIWFFPKKGFAAIKVQDWVSVIGGADRADALPDRDRDDPAAALAAMVDARGPRVEHQLGSGRAHLGQGRRAAWTDALDQGGGLGEG